MIVAIIGRPNVGKSTLFNRLIGRKVAIVDDISGVTRDWKIMPAKIADLDFDVIDSAGQFGFEENNLAIQITQQLSEILSQADVILFVVDGRQSVMNNDYSIAKILREKFTKPVALIANKCESEQKIANLDDFYKLGFGGAIKISAEHGIGTEKIYKLLKTIKNKVTILNAKSLLDNNKSSDINNENKNHLVESEKNDDDIQDPLMDGEQSQIKDAEQTIDSLRIAIVGRPNAGKSTLINHILGQQRLLTGEQPGVTRDAIENDYSYNKRNVILIDTAGMRRKSRINKRLERLSVNSTLNAIQYAEMVILLLDAQNPLEKQDLNIAEYVIKEGRGLIIAANKSDLKKGNWLKEEIEQKLENTLPQAKNIPAIAVSAKTGKNVNVLLKAVLKTEELWNTRITTGALNQWLQIVTRDHQPPLDGNRRIKIKYITQIKIRPPTFAIFISKPTKLVDSYIKYLLNRLRADFKLPGIPIRIITKKGKNPYAEKI